MNSDQAGFIPEMQGWFSAEHADNCITSIHQMVKEKKHDHLDETYHTVLIKLEIVQKELKDSTHMIENEKSISNLKSKH